MSGNREAAAMAMPNGPGAAAILSAGLGCFALALLAWTADKSAFVKQAMNLYQPTGPLSGVSTAAVAIWLLSWGALWYCWRNRNVALGRVCWIGFGLLVLSVLSTFPPIADLL